MSNIWEKLCSCGINRAQTDTRAGARRSRHVLGKRARKGKTSWGRPYKGREGDRVYLSPLATVVNVAFRPSGFVSCAARVPITHA